MNESNLTQKEKNSVYFTKYLKKVKSFKYRDQFGQPILDGKQLGTPMNFLPPCLDPDLKVEYRSDEKIMGKRFNLPDNQKRLF